MEIRGTFEVAACGLTGTGSAAQGGEQQPRKILERKTGRGQPGFPKVSQFPPCSKAGQPEYELMYPATFFLDPDA